MTNDIEKRRWIQYAVCKPSVGSTNDQIQERVNIFFPNDAAGATSFDIIRKAKEFCVVCPVASQCLEYGIETDSIGIWGGMTEVERRDKTRRRMIAKLHGS